MSSLMVDFITSPGPEYLAWMEEDEKEEHIALMGATTYREMLGTPPRCLTIPASPH
jgi:hypothetical protein